MIALMPDCGVSATARVEGYSPAAGRTHGSLDAAVYACDAHAQVAVDAVTAAGLTPYVAHRTGEGARCGRVWDYVSLRVVHP